VADELGGDKESTRDAMDASDSALRPVTYAIHMNPDLSPTPSTAPIGVNGVPDSSVSGQWRTRQAQWGSRDVDGVPGRAGEGRGRSMALLTGSGPSGNARVSLERGGVPGSRNAGVTPQKPGSSPFREPPASAQTTQ
jgi:hypothetical protein